MTAPDAAAQIRVAGGKHFTRRLAAITIVGFVIRAAYVVIRRDHPVAGDSFFYHEGANLLVDGHGFIAPFQHFLGATVEAADHPPLYLLYLSIPSVFRLDTAFAHMLWSALLGTGTIVVVGLLGRRVAGARVGLLSAALAAAYPNVWAWDAVLLSETLAIFLATLALLIAYRQWEHPSTRGALAFGAVCGAAALARSELLLLVPALLAPVVLLAPHDGWRERGRRFATGAVVVLVVLTPWAVFNLTRFEHPVLLSAQFEPTLAGANCRDTYSGPALGYLTTTCLKRLDSTEDESVNGRILRDRAERFVRDHLDRVPVVVAARLGRVLGVYRPAQQIDFDVFEGRERGLAMVAAWSYYLVAILAVAGAVVLRRARATPLFPLLVLPGIVLLTVAITYGTTRFRAAAETSLVVLAAIAIDAAISRIRSRTRPDATAP